MFDLDLYLVASDFGFELEGLLESNLVVDFDWDFVQPWFLELPVLGLKVPDWESLTFLEALKVFICEVIDSLKGEDFLTFGSCALMVTDLSEVGVKSFLDFCSPSIYNGFIFLSISSIS